MEAEWSGAFLLESRQAESKNMRGAEQHGETVRADFDIVADKIAVERSQRRWNHAGPARSSCLRRSSLWYLSLASVLVVFWTCLHFLCWKKTWKQKSDRKSLRHYQALFRLFSGPNQRTMMTHRFNENPKIGNDCVVENHFPCRHGWQDHAWMQSMQMYIQLYILL